MKKIAIDCRYFGKSGIGRVLEGILDNLDYGKNQYVLIGKKENLARYHPFSIFEDDTNPFTKEGLFTSWKEINKSCDCVFIPNFIIPISIKIPVYTIMHDLVFLDRKDITTNGFLDFEIKKSLLKRCATKSKHIFCVSKFTMERCCHYYPNEKDKFSLTYNGLSKGILNYKAVNIEKKNQIIFVGNVKKHKGITTLLKAFEKEADTNMKLKIIGKKENFITGLDITGVHVRNVEFTGFITDEEMYREIASSKYLILPSLYEGFGIPPLEAICLKTQPIVSDIQVFREIYSGLPVKYFHDENELAKLIAEKPDPISDTIIDECKNRYQFSKMVKSISECMESE